MSGWLILGGIAALFGVAALAMLVVHGAELAERRERVLARHHDADLGLLDDGDWDIDHSESPTR